MLNQLVRYHPVIQNINKGGYRSVCEIGSGCHGITKFLKRRVYGVDINFFDYTVSRQPCSPDLVPVISDAEKLPFNDEEFDLVFSCDMLEHVPAGKRERVISEMIRVANRTVIILFPCGVQALESEKRLRNYFHRRKKRVPPWLTEHLSIDFPMFEEILPMLNKINLPYKTNGSENRFLHNMIIKAESMRNIGKLLTVMSSCYKPGRNPSASEKLKNRLLRAFLSFADIKPTYRLYIEIAKAE